MKSMSSRVLLIALLLPVSAFATGGSLAWNGKAPSDPAKQLPNAEASASAETKSEAGAAPAVEGSAAATAAPAAAPSAAATASASASASAKPAAASSGLIAAPPAGKGQIVFFRPAKFVGGAVGYKVREGAVELGKLRSGKYFVVAVEPGAHEYTVHSEAKDILNMEVEAGETYYVKGTITIGILAGRPNLSPSTVAEFDEIAGKLKLAK
ncbi:DUF2846 domain-containing protein [Lysobacter sp. ESA13C]|uniref:DUF2846 domain-containing protein n=1 Tax=Lysobacter sp. ESA13C TaxID=2862676 RepID=UPI001CBCF6C6|nr:DUF2846 domain-containing protein [Lysobacter sp. ESA13C]